MKRFSRISALLWADYLVKFAFFTMQNYLTDVWNLTVTHAAGILNIWEGICKILPVFLLFLVDQFLGNFRMLVISSIAHSGGIGLVVMSVSSILAHFSDTCKECTSHTHKVAFFIGMSLLAMGLAGHLVSVKPFLKEQEEKPVEEEDKSTTLFGFVTVVIIPIIGLFSFPYIKSWTLRFGIPAISSAVATLCFSGGWLVYYKAKPQGSPLANVCRVVAASFFNRSKSLPSDARQFYRRKPSEPWSFSKTRFLSCLHKAAITLPDELSEDHREYAWKLCSVADVEEAKILVRMIPLWLTFIVCGIVSSTGNSYFSEQANNMNRRIGKWKVPSPILYMLYGLIKYGFGKCASCFERQNLAPRASPKDKNYRPAVGIAMAMVFSILCCITAAKIETKRLTVIRNHGLLGKPDEDIPMNAAWLIFQFILLAGLDSFLPKSIDEFHRGEGPESMMSCVNHLARAVYGVGYMCGVLSVYVVGKVSQIGGRQNWFQQSLNESRLDRYYWFLAALSSVNLVVYIGVASTYSYHKPEAQEEEISH